MDNTEKQPEKAGTLGAIGKGMLVAVLLIVGWMAWGWYRQRKVDAQMKKVRSFRENKNDNVSDNTRDS